MNEGSFIRAVHRQLPPPAELHRWKINARFSNGVADCWYSGEYADLWVEYKFIKETPVRSFTPDATALQLKWLDDRYREHRNVALVVGCPDWALILRHGAWRGKVTLSGQELTTIKGVAEWIIKQTLNWI